MVLLFVSTVTLPKVNSQNFQVIYWELKPYIWVENGELDGILPFMLHKAKAYCDKQNSVEITFSVNLNTLPILRRFYQILALTNMVRVNWQILQIYIL